MKKTLAVISVAFLFLIMAGLAFAKKDDFAGTWKLDANKSKFSTGQSRKSETRVVEFSAQGMRVSVKRVNADGNTQEFEYTTNLDGKDYPITGAGPYGANTIASNLADPNTIQATLKNQNKLVATATAVVSKDGKVLTITTKGTDSNGKHFHNVSVYDKVSNQQ
ncbi:MAG: hypothetical protein WBR26_10850 [Candidatus Acidiferrum sp.]